MAKKPRTFTITGYRLVWTYRHPSGGEATNASHHETFDEARTALRTFKPDPELSLTRLGVEADEVETTDQ